MDWYHFRTLVNDGHCHLQGRIVEIYGPEASGKTTLALHIIKEAQNLGGVLICRLIICIGNTVHLCSSLV